MSRPKNIKETRFEFLKRSAAEHEASETCDACLIWPFSANGGYGTLAWNPIPDYPSVRVNEKAHRIAYFLRYGVLPRPCGLHSCDDPLCYNWRHITPGDDLRNARERVERGLARGAKGSANAAAKLSDELVAEIKVLSATLSHVAIASKLSMHRGSIERALHGKTWAHTPAHTPTDKSRYAWLKKAVADHGDSQACLLWPFPVSEESSGPKLNLRGTKYMAHHVSYRLLHGFLPMPCGVRTCANLLCINPHHTKSAQQRFNGSAPYGVRNSSSKLTWEIVREIRKAGVTESQQTIAKRYGVSQSLISSIRRNVIWIENIGPDSSSDPIANS